MAKYTSIIDPPKNKPATTSSSPLVLTRGKMSKKYTPASAETGHPEYGPAGKGTKVASILNDARSKKQDIAYDKSGKPYRAGYTETTQEPDKVSTTIDVHPQIPAPKKQRFDTIKVSKSMNDIRQQNGKSMKRRLPRVEWLKGNNKKTEAGFGK